MPAVHSNLVLVSPDPARELREIDAAIDHVVDEHFAATGKPRFHGGRCGRIDLHHQLVALHARKQELTAQIADGRARRSEKASESSEKLTTRAG
jgi:hypothetical protein